MLKRPDHCAAMGTYDCQVPMPCNGQVCWIDYCVADIVSALNAANIKTVASCCGHGGVAPARIDLADGRVLIIKMKMTNGGE